jgi:ABC-type glycerol-3-phosphate transport system substrate-binding protein
MVSRPSWSRRRLLAGLALTPLAIAGCATFGSVSNGILGKPPRQTLVVYPGPVNALRPVIHRLPTNLGNNFQLRLASDASLQESLTQIGESSAAVSTVYASLIEAISRLTPVDLVVFDPGRLASLGDTGTLLDLNSLLRGQTWFTRDEFWPTVLDAGRYQGKQLGVPLEVAIEVLVYNPRRFQQAGAQPPTATWTWSDAVDAARRLTLVARDRSVFGSYWGMIATETAPNVVGLAWQNGAQVILDNARNVTVTEPGTLEALKLLASLVGPSGVAPSPDSLRGGQGGDSDSSLLLGSGQAGMAVSLVSGSDAGHWWSGTPMSPNVAIAAVPQGPQRIMFGSVTWLVGVATKSTDPDAAAAALKLLSDTSGEVLWPPARRNGISLAKANPFITSDEESVLLASLANVRVAPGGLPSELWTVLANQLAAPILNGATNLSEIDRTAQGYVDQLINFVKPPPPPLPASS